jgi:hypothetical protein
MITNIACFVPSCNEPVIGQCPGHSVSCGRFYCAKHSGGGLCAECGKRRAWEEERIAQQNETQRIQQDFVATAKSIPSGPPRWLIWLGIIFIGPYAVGTAIAIALWIIAAPFLPSLGVLSLKLNGINFIIFMLLGVLVGLVIALIEILIIRSIVRRLIRFKHRRSSQFKAKIAQIDAVKPGFAEFYQSWRKERNRALLENIGWGVLAIFAVALLGATQTSEDEKLRRIVDDELTRHGH